MRWLSSKGLNGPCYAPAESDGMCFNTFISSSHRPEAPKDLWGVNFGSGTVLDGFAESDSVRIICVRSGP
jgi:hypothetical protein